MGRYADINPLLSLLAGKDPLESVNVGAVLQMLQISLLEQESIPRAHWEACFCSNCKSEAITEWSEAGGEILLTKYCPHCGAKMDE